MVKGSIYNSKLIECSKTITGDIETTTETCFNEIGVIQNIGFSTAKTGLVPYIQVCYNMNTGSVIYTRHIIPGIAIRSNFVCLLITYIELFFKIIFFKIIYADSVQESARPSFKSTGSASQIKPATSYTQASQLKRLTTLLGSATQAAKFIFTNSFLSKGHLAPDGDGVLRSWQFSTYFYSNAAPEWQVVNAGNWLRVENIARTKADLLQSDLLIFTGNDGVLTLPHLNGTEIEITLEENGNLVVPKYYWKIIKNVVTNSGIVLITLNNPFAISITPMCTDVCQMTGWSNVNYGDYSKGFTYCCTVSSFFSVIVDIPLEAYADNILFY